MIDNYSEPTNFVKPKKTSRANRTTPILKNTEGKFIYGREEEEAITLMLGIAQAHFKKERDMNTPFYRANKIDSDEWVIGWLANPTPSLFYIFYNNCGYLNIHNEVCIQEDERAEIDPSTISIHFPNMIDKNGTKIFVSLGEDGVGGDELKYNDGQGIAKLLMGCAVLDFGDNDIRSIADLHNNDYGYKTEVIGIHKG